MTETIERQRAERDYSKGIIYKLCCNDLNIKEIYVGSTTNFKDRKSKHKHSCNKEKSKAYNLKVYQYIRSNGGWDNWDMILLENYNATDSHHLEARERYWLETLKATLNCQIPTRTEKEKNIEYRKQNTDKIKYKRSINFTCECGGKYTHHNKAQHLKRTKHLNYLATPRLIL